LLHYFNPDKDNFIKIYRDFHKIKISGKHKTSFQLWC